MEFGGNGGFQGYHRLPRPVAGVTAPEICMGLSAQMNQAINNDSSADDYEYPAREQDCFMPMANVTRIMRKILPTHAKISDEAKEMMQESVSEFISFITGEANDNCRNEQRKTITAEDVLFAMNNLGFDDYIEPLTRYLHHYREYDDSQRGLLRTESIRAADPIICDNATFAPFVANHHFFSGPASMNRFLNNPSSASPYQVAATNLDPFATMLGVTRREEERAGAK